MKIQCVECFCATLHALYGWIEHSKSERRRISYRISKPFIFPFLRSTFNFQECNCYRRWAIRESIYFSLVLAPYPDIKQVRCGDCCCFHPKEFSRSTHLNAPTDYSCESGVHHKCRRRCETPSHSEIDTLDCLTVRMRIGKTIQWPTTIFDFWQMAFSVQLECESNSKVPQKNSFLGISSLQVSNFSFLFVPILLCCD